jgi:hypothetical protein
MSLFLKMSTVLLVTVPMALLCFWGAIDREAQDLSVDQAIVLVVLGLNSTAISVGWSLAMKEELERARSG